jgi:predicted GNAT superfamily acetyltransferase
MKVDFPMVEYRDLETADDFLKCVEVQSEVWGREFAVPHHMLISAKKFGGIAIGAFEGEKLIGFVFGIPGIYDGKLIHYSHMTAVIPSERYRGVGFKLKLLQRERALAQGIDLIVWTFDPLQCLNAWFNIGKLGVIVRRYSVNHYGPLNDKINRGLESDRLYAEWWIRSRRVEERILGKKLDRIPEGSILVEIPVNINEIKERDIEEAKRWLMRVRSELINYLSSGYIIHEVLRDERGCFYVLSKTELEDVLSGEVYTKKSI